MPAAAAPATLRTLRRDGADAAVILGIPSPSFVRIAIALALDTRTVERSPAIAGATPPRLHRRFIVAVTLRF
jgi:hypothetical protein